MIVRSYNNNFEVMDWTEEVRVIPNQWGFLEGLGLFEVEPVSQHTVTFEESTLYGALLIDKVRGERGTQGQDGGRKVHAFSIPHFPHDDTISPQDLQGKLAYSGKTAAGQVVDTKEAVRAKKLVRMRQNHAWTLEYARAQLITAGTVYAPGNTVAQNWNTEFGVTRLSIDCLLGTSTTDIIAKLEQAIAQIQDNAFGAQVDGSVTLCSPGFFAKLIAHPVVKTAYTYYKQTGANPLKERLADGFSMGMRRHLDFGGTVFVELRDSYTTQSGSVNPLIPTGKAYMVPLGTSGVFKTFFSPANRFDLVNTMGEQVYVFETPDNKGTKIELESESNFANGLMRPAMIVELTSSN